MTRIAKVGAEQCSRYIHPWVAEDGAQRRPQAFARRRRLHAAGVCAPQARLDFSKRSIQQIAESESRESQPP